jgi:hypothetical protein
MSDEDARRFISCVNARLRYVHHMTWDQAQAAIDQRVDVLQVAITVGDTVKAAADLIAL